MWVLDLLLTLVWRLFKFTLHRWTDQSRIERLLCACGGAPLDGGLIHAVEMEIIHSKKIVASVRENILSNRPFHVEGATQTVAAAKGIVDAETLVKLRGCMSAISEYNGVMEELRGLKVPYSKANPTHEAALEELWDALRPGVRRNGGRITKEWQEIGFQVSLSRTHPLLHSSHQLIMHRLIN